MNCRDKIKKWLKKQRLVKNGDSITVAVSGGPDSMAMLTIIKEFAPSMDLHISAAHLNHRIRPEAENEAALVSDYCEELDIPLRIGESNVPTEAESSGKGLEETARELRYSFLTEAAKHFAADSVALGHNLNDQAETVLHHVIRGSGITGLAGIQPRRGIFIRPLLCCGRDEIEEYIEENEIPFAVDRSNFDESYLRNRIRNSLLPDLEADYNPSISDSLARLAENISEMITSAKDGISSLITLQMKDDAVSIPMERVNNLSDFNIYMLTDAVLEKFFNVHQDILKCHFDAVKSLIRNSTSGKGITLPHGITIQRDQVSLRFYREEKETTMEPEPFRIPAEGIYTLPDWDFKAAVRRVGPAERSSLKSTPDQAYLANIEFPLVIRTRNQGDRIQPFGMNGTRKLSDIMIDRKVPLNSRDTLPVIEDAAGIVWVPGLVTSERTRVTGKSERVIRIKLRRGI